MSSTHIVIVGAGGRMGERIGALAVSDAAVTVSAKVERDEVVRMGEGGFMAARECVPGRVGRCDVVIDFSSEEGLVGSMAIARAFGCPLLVGTTGLSAAAVGRLRDLSAATGVLLAPNTSLGVVAVGEAVTALARRLGAGYAVTIVETHHTKKKDAPSGTALRLAEAVKAGGGVVGDIKSIREGEVVGEHTVRLEGNGEVIEVVHKALSRDLFALGALRAGKWLVGKGKGWYGVGDVG